MRTYNLFLVFIYLFYTTTLVFCFNLDSRVPIIKTVPAKDSYFGYSVAQHIIHGSYRGGRSAFNGSRILVGAPRAQSHQEGANHSGAVFDCPLSTDKYDCVMLNIENTGDIMDDEFKDDQWLGVTVRSQGPGGAVMACAHRYVKKGEHYRWGNGICYSLTQYLDFDSALDPCVGRAVQKAHEQYGYCQAGTSGMIAEDNSIVIGTPGPYTWRGTVFINSVGRDIGTDYNWYKGPLLDNFSPVEKYSYLGMAVTSGRFLSSNTMSYVAGAPRANNTGQVVFFAREGSAETLKVQLILKGDLFASSFGYEIAAADFNNDSIPDLIVGAPFYYKKNTGGAIYVYHNSARERINSRTVPIKITGKSDSRFGIAIANCRDLNKDDYEDIAVGAPYEGRGVVYIFLGSRNGIVTTPVQVIKAESVPMSPRTFGHSLSGGLDLDLNKYPDLVVGAYESDTVVLLLARPVIKIVTTFENIVNISPTLKECREDKSWKHGCFSFRTCFQITSKEAIKTSSVLINYTIEDETFYGRQISRVKLLSYTTTNHSVSREILLSESRLLDIHCEPQLVYLLENIKDFLTPLKFKLTHSLVQPIPRPLRAGDPVPEMNDYPILNQQEASKIFQVDFEKDCGGNNICESDLHLNVRVMPEGNISLGEDKFVTLEISVHNKNESAYEAAVYIMHPKSLGYTGVNVTSESPELCESIHPIMVKCILENPFKHLPAATIFKVRFSTKYVKDEENQLFFTVKANSTSKERYPKSDTIIILKVIRKANLTYTKISQPEQVKYGGEIRGQSSMVTESDVGSEINHTHVINNHGPWHVSALTMTFHWPYELKPQDNKQHGKWILYLLEKPKILHAYGTCDIPDEFVNPLQLTLSQTPIDSREFESTLESMAEGSSSSTTRETETSRHSSQTETHYEETRRETTVTRTGSKTTQTKTTRTETSVREKREAPHSSPLTSKKVVLRCDDTAKCLKFQCTIYKLGANKDVIIRMRARIWNSTFVSEFPTADTVEIVTSVDVEIFPAPKLELIEPFATSHTITTSAYSDIPPKVQETPYWVYILAACIGILLLLLLILCLWKLGFFKRKKPEAMMKGNLEKHNEYNHDY